MAPGPTSTQRAYKRLRAQLLLDRAKSQAWARLATFFPELSSAWHMFQLRRPETWVVLPELLADMESVGLSPPPNLAKGSFCNYTNSDDPTTYFGRVLLPAYAHATVFPMSHSLAGMPEHPHLVEYYYRRPPALVLGRHYPV